jgi:hypothetical protein
MEASQFERDLNEGRTRVHPETGDPYKTTSWASVDLEPYKRGEKVIAPPKYLTRDDGKALIYPGRPHTFYGESESLKTRAALLACRSVVDAGGKVVYADLEGSEASFVERCRVVGIGDAHIGEALRYVRPTVPLKGDAKFDFWHHELDIFAPTLVVLDGVTELYALQGWDINSQTDAAEFQASFAFHRGGVASISIDHTPKDAGRGVIGAQHKRAGLDGAEYEFKPLVRAGRGGQSEAKVSVTKDRHGYVREWAGSGGGLVGTLKVGVPDGKDRVVLATPRLQDLMDPHSDAQDRALEYIRENPGASTRSVRDGAGLGDDSARDAVSALEMLAKVENRGTKARHSWYEAAS